LRGIELDRFRGGSGAGLGSRLAGRGLGRLDGLERRIGQETEIRGGPLGELGVGLLGEQGLGAGGRGVHGWEVMRRPPAGFAVRVAELGAGVQSGACVELRLNSARGPARWS